MASTDDCTKDIVTRHDSCRRRTVHFSSELVFIKPSYPHCETSSKWFSNEDHAHHKVNLIQDFLEARRLLATAPTQDLIDDQISKFLGIETFLSPGFARCVLMDKRQHISMIIAHQVRLQMQDLCDLSDASSRISRERAHRSAVSYWKMSN
mmetsp:Transcript_14601/g.26392  ORF Transcript_14601/g.26392 Transcript_14601/m.26392 type:complete len:151 (-) Transcript_14601:176-628(-)